MNSPKEKAKKLVRQYWDLGGIDVLEAKQCALIAVDEILNNDNNFFNTYSQNDYWLQVKQEINLL
jgi:hypothetical protein